MKIKELTPEQYEQFLADSGSAYNFMQSAQFVRSHLDREEIVILGGEEEGRLLYAVVVLLRPAMRLFRYATSLREWVAASPDLFTDQKKLQEFVSQAGAWLKKQKAIVWFVESNVEYQQHDRNGAVVENGFHNEAYRDLLEAIGFEKGDLWVGYDEARQSRWVSWIDLQKGLPETFKGFPAPLENGLEEYTWAELLKGMAGNTRRSFQKTDLPYIECTVVKGSEPFDLSEFDSLLEMSAEKHHFGTGSGQNRAELLKAFGDHGYLATSYLNLDAYAQYLREQKEQLLEKEAKAQEVCEQMPNSKKKRNQLLEIQDALAHNEKESLELKKLQEQETSERIALAGGIFFETPSEMVYLFGGSRPDLARYMGPYATQKTMIHMALDHKLQRYNFWGISGNFQPDEEGYGVYFFKKNLGATVGEYAGEFYMPLVPLLAKPYLKKIRPQA